MHCCDLFCVCANCNRLITQDWPPSDLVGCTLKCWGWKQPRGCFCKYADLHQAGNKNMMSAFVQTLCQCTVGVRGTPLIYDRHPQQWWLCLLIKASQETFRAFQSVSSAAVTKNNYSSLAQAVSTHSHILRHKSWPIWPMVFLFHPPLPSNWIGGPRDGSTRGSQMMDKQEWKERRWLRKHRTWSKEAKAFPHTCICIVLSDQAAEVLFLGAVNLKLIDRDTPALYTDSS